MIALLFFCFVSFSPLPSTDSQDFIEYPGSTSFLTLNCTPGYSPLSWAPCEVSASNDAHLSISITVKQVKNADLSRFRAHPLLISCLQSLYSSLSSQLHILQFYLPLEDDLAVPTNNSYINEQLKLYHKFGLAVSFSISNATTDVVMNQTILHCWDLFSRNRFAVGIVALNQSMLALLLLSNQTLFYPNSLETRFYTLLDNSLIPQYLPKCSNETFAPNSTYPEGISKPELIVGSVSSVISRTSSAFLYLQQYPATSISFTDCAPTITGASVETRCATRVMSSRIYHMLRVLSALISKIKAGALEVVRSWSPVPFNVSHLACFSSLNTSLFSDGRAMLLRSGGSLNLTRLATVARCSGFDYVYYGCGYVLVAVRNQRRIPPFIVVFPKSVLLPVTIHGPDSSLYDIAPSAASPSPLFDLSGIRDRMLTDGLQLRQLAGSQRYFRMHPVLVGCLRLLEERLSSYYPNASLRIIHSYSRNNEDISAVDRRDFRTGLAIQINVIHQRFSLFNLTQLAIESCASYVSLQRSPFKRMQFGLYIDSLYLAIATNFTAWNETNSLPLSTTTASFTNWVEEHYKAAVNRHLVNPTRVSLVCSSVIPPSPPHLSYSSPYSSVGMQLHLEEVKNCEPKEDTKFCRESFDARGRVYSDILAVMRRKYWPKELPLENALFNCFTLCSTCTEGKVWRMKLAGCDNVVHWAPFKLLHEPNNMHFYALDNLTIEKFACSKLRFCIKKSPLYAVLAPTVEYSFRANSEQSYERYLYSMKENPLPVFHLLNSVFAISGIGNVTIWVSDELELLELRHILRILMLYNKNVDFVNIQLFQVNQFPAVQVQMNAYIKEWTTQNCPTYTREMLAPYTISIVQNSIRSKREEHFINENYRLMDFQSTR